MEAMSKYFGLKYPITSAQILMKPKMAREFPYGKKTYEMQSWKAMKSRQNIIRKKEDHEEKTTRGHDIW